MQFKHLEDYLDHTKSVVDAAADGMHPEDRVAFYRDVADHATRNADGQTEINDSDGVPER